jgi:nucleotide-binding universal stress UspA family protein
VAIVVGYIPTREGRAALHRAAAEARMREATLIVVSSNRGGRDFDAVEAQHFEEALREIRGELEAAGVRYEERALVRGSEPADDLIAVATEVDADLIVIGLRRRSPVGKLLLGSNAQRILLEALCPVLAVKAPSP